MNETRVYPPKLMTLMSGVAYLTTDNDNTTLHYTDGTTETGICPFNEDTDFFTIVSIIQSQREQNK